MYVLFFVDLIYFNFCKYVRDVRKNIKTKELKRGEKSIYQVLLHSVYINNLHWIKEGINSIWKY